MASHTPDDPRIEFEYPGKDTMTIVLSGIWKLRTGLPVTAEVTQQLDGHPGVKSIKFDSRQLGEWDTSLPVFLHRVLLQFEKSGLATDTGGLPEGVQKLLAMAQAVPSASVSSRHSTRMPGVLEEIGEMTLRMFRGLPYNLQFIGEILFSFARLVTGKAQFRVNDLLLIIQQVGPNALPIVSLVSFLVGLIVAYMGAAQLERVGVQIYIADLVGIAMVREIGALMTGIIMAGRTGAAFAAELGTMQVNEEIDAFKTLGISTIDFLVMPRIFSLLLMIPILTLYAGLVGTLAGMVIGITVFDITLFEYWQQTLRALELKQFWVGIFKGTVYGAVIGISGCLRGMQCGRSALAVGEATTSAVVTSIVYIVITASAMTIVFYKLDI